MRILFLSSWFPYPPDNGSRIRAFNLLKQLAPRHEVTLLSFTDPEWNGTHVRALDRFCARIVTTPAIPFRPTRLKALIGFASPRPRSIVATHSSVMQLLVNAELEHEPYDVVVASELGTAPYVSERSKFVRLFDDAEVGIYRNGVTSEMGWKHISGRLRWLKFGSFFQKLVLGFDMCTVVSRVEEKAVLALGIEPRHIAIIPNGIDSEWYQAQGIEPERGAIIFNGALTFVANLDAMRYFLKEIWPQVRVQAPYARLRITGRHDGVALNQLSLDEGVELTGYLGDIRPALQASQVCVVPIRVGGGTRVKILEAMAAGTPVVSTSKGAEGLDVIAGDHILIADEPAEFARQTVRVLQDRALAACLATQARELVATRYDWNRIGAQFNALLSETVVGKPSC